MLWPGPLLYPSSHFRRHLQSASHDTVRSRALEGTSITSAEGHFKRPIESPSEPWKSVILLVFFSQQCKRMLQGNLGQEEG